MKLIVFYLGALAAVLLQVTMFSGSISVNLVLAVIVVSTLQLRASDVAPIAILSGLLLDIHSGTFFGFNILFLLIASITAKYVVHLGERAVGFWSVIVTLGLLEILYLFIQLVMMFSIERYRQLGVYFVSGLTQLILTLLVGSLLYMAAIWLQNYLTRGQAKKRWLQG